MVPGIETGRARSEAGEQYPGCSAILIPVDCLPIQERQQCAHDQKQDERSNYPRHPGPQIVLSFDQAPDKCRSKHCSIKPYARHAAACDQDARDEKSQSCHKIETGPSGQCQNDTAQKQNSARESQQSPNPCAQISRDRPRHLPSLLRVYYECRDELWSIALVPARFMNDCS